MKKKIKDISIFILLIATPPLLQFIADSKFVLDILAYYNVKENTIKLVTDGCLLGSLILAEIAFASTYIYYKYKVARRDRDYLYLLRQVKEDCQTVLRYILRKNNKSFNINIRIFVPYQKKRDIILKRVFHKSRPIYLMMNNIEGFADKSIPAGLTFQVYPKAQGLVGLCYTSKVYIFCPNLQTSANDYNLSSYQKTQTRQTAFCTCIPIVNKDDKVCAIMSFDSTEGAEISEKQKGDLFDYLEFFSSQIHQNMNKLFKRGACI